MQKIQIKPQPELPEADREYFTYRQCSKCGGTGFFCTHIENGIPQSMTGFDCWACEGAGWKQVYKRGMKRKHQAENYSEGSMVYTDPDTGDLVERMGIINGLGEVREWTGEPRILRLAKDR